MSRLRVVYDRLARPYTLKWAVAFTIIFSMYPTVGIVLLVKYFHSGDSFYLIFGPLNMLLGWAGVVHGALLIHAVARRMQGPSGPQN